MKKVIIITVFVSVGCKCRTVQQTTYESIKEYSVLRDTVFTIPEETTRYVADVLFRKDSTIALVNPVVTHNKTSVLQPPRVSVQGQKLIVDCELEEQKLYAQWKEKHVSETKEIVREQPVRMPLTFLQKLLIYAGAASIGFGIFWLICRFYILK